jgi:hypothetical protein
MKLILVIQIEAFTTSIDSIPRSRHEHKYNECLLHIQYVTQLDN